MGVLSAQALPEGARWIAFCRIHRLAVAKMMRPEHIRAGRGVESGVEVSSDLFPTAFCSGWGDSAQLSCRTCAYG